MRAIYYTRLYTRYSGTLNVGKNQSFEKTRFSFEEHKKKFVRQLLNFSNIPRNQKHVKPLSYEIKFLQLIYLLSNLFAYKCCALEVGSQNSFPTTIPLTLFVSLLKLYLVKLIHYIMAMNLNKLNLISLKGPDIILVQHRFFVIVMSITMNDNQELQVQGSNGLVKVSHTKYRPQKGDAERDREQDMTPKYGPFPATNNNAREHYAVSVGQSRTSDQCDEGVHFFTLCVIATKWKMRMRKSEKTNGFCEFLLSFLVQRGQQNMKCSFNSMSLPKHNNTVLTNNFKLFLFCLVSALTCTIKTLQTGVWGVPIYILNFSTGAYENIKKKKTNTFVT
ncbi:hypothetical protein QTP88_017770 [Uroleucon formosanum]